MDEIKVHIKGMDTLIRKFDRTRDGVEEALDEGCQDAADHLQESIENKFGVYQPWWKKLLYSTIHKKSKKGNNGNANKPLVDFGDMMFSFSTITSNRTRKHTVTVVSDDERLAYHVYGAPSMGVPKRDPVRPTTIEEREECVKIVEDAVREVIGDDE